VVVTACGLRGDLLEKACATGEAPAIAALRGESNFAGTIATPAVDCLAAHASLFLGVPPSEHRIRGPASDVAAAAGSSFVSMARARRAATAAFLSRPLVARAPAWGEVDFGFALYDLPPIDHFSVSMFGADAAALEPRRDDDATLAAALAWLAHAGTPFLLWVELDALEIETGDTTAEHGRIATLDHAVMALRRELRRAGRDRRTCFILTADHGEALGDGDPPAFGHRLPLDGVARVPLIVADPEARAPWSDPPADLTALGARLMARFGGRAPPIAPAPPPIDRSNPFDFDGPLSEKIERGSPPLTEEAARAALPRLREAIAARPDVLPIAEQYLAALHALESPNDDEQAELQAARSKWLERVAFGMPHRPLAAALFSRYGGELGATPERREAAAEQAVRAAPWYFPAVRALAVALSLRAPTRAADVLEKFGATAPLSPAARDEFKRQLERTHLGLGPLRDPK
jgi:sulfatase-like protein